jgi:hypothetical protein
MDEFLLSQEDESTTGGLAVIIRFVIAVFALGLAGISIAQQPAQPGVLTGVWSDGQRVFTFMPGGHAAVAIAENGAPFAVLTYEISGNEIRIADIDGFTPCVGMTALYEFDVDGDTATVTAVEDPCPARDTGGEPIELTRMPLQPQAESGPQ